MLAGLGEVVDRPLESRKETHVSKKAEELVDAIVTDLTDRRGLRQAWDSIDEDVKLEIRQSWAKIIVEILP